MLKKYALLITTLYSFVLIVACLLPSKEIPDINVSFGDKIFHSLAYLVLTFLWFYTMLFHFNKNKNIAILYASFFSIVFGIIIELLQEALTTTRQADALDALANLLGTLLAMFLLFLKKSKYS